MLTPVAVFCRAWRAKRAGNGARGLAEGPPRSAPQRKARRRRGGIPLAVPATIAGVGAAGYGVYTFSDSLAETALGRIIAGQYNRFYDEYIKPLYMPASDTLLPEQDPSMRGRYTVVIDMDKTLVSSTWDRKYGWRTVKRPGADDLLALLSQHCEVVLFSDKDHGTGSDTAMKLDPGQMLFHHQLHREYTKWSNGRLVKDMTMLNRDLRKVIVIDKEAKAFSPTPTNGVTVQPFEFKEQVDLADEQLLVVADFVKYVIRESPEDVREVIADLQSRGDPLAVFAQEQREREAQSKQQMQKSVVSRLKGALESAEGQQEGAAPAASSRRSPSQAAALRQRQRQQQQKLEHGGVMARAGTAMEDVKQAAERARAWALAQYTVGIIGMPPQAAFAEQAAQAQEQAQSLSGMLTGGAGMPQMPNAPPPPPRLPTKHATLDGREPESPTLWMRVKEWADQKQEEQQMIMADFQRQQMEAWQRQQMAQQAQQKQAEEKEYEERAQQIAAQRERIRRAKAAQQQKEPDQETETGVSAGAGASA